MIRFIFLALLAITFAITTTVAYGGDFGIPTLEKIVGFDLGVLTLAIIPIIDMYNTSEFGLGRFTEVHPLNYIRSMALEGQARFGRALETGVNPQNASLYNGAVSRFIGVAAYSADATFLNTDTYADKDPVGVIASGMVAVFCEEAVNFGDPVRIRHTDGVGPNLGRLRGSFCKTADATRTTLLNGAEFRKTTTGAGETTIFLSGNYTQTND